MLTPQQQEALRYFSRVAGEWKRKTEGTDPQRKFNVIAARNAFVLSVASEMKTKGCALDVGCGTGELVYSLAQQGFRVTGIDFAPAMIRLAQEKAAMQGVQAEFVCASIFEKEFPPHSFDLISANGFIEYIAPGELAVFLQRAHQLLRKSGTLVVGSRNRLFNAFSLNAFTTMELESGALPALVREAGAIACAEDMPTLIEHLAAMQVSLPRHTAHPGTTGIAVSVRHQYTPGELIRLFREHGFTVHALHPVHYHAAPPRFKDAYPSPHADLATLFQSFARLELLPFSSTFMVAARLL